jgi:hypothetical protein
MIIAASLYPPKTPLSMPVRTMFGIAATIHMSAE